MNKVAIIGTRGYPSFYGGFETAIRQLAPYLSTHGWSVTVYGRAHATMSPTRNDGVTTVMTAGINKKSLSTLSYGFTSVLHALVHKPDVALVMNVANGFWLPLLKLRGVPTVVNVDGIEWDRAKWGRLAKAVFRGGAAMTAWWADELIVDAREIGRRWKADYKRDGVFIPYGGDVPAMSKADKNEFENRQYVLLVARFVPENSVVEFFEAISVIRQRLDVVIVGSSGFGGDLDDQARVLSETFSNVHWLGHVSDDERLFSLWRNATVYFHGHSVGGTNPALVQAMASGAPVVARDTPYNREVLGPEAILVAPEANAIAEAVTQVASDSEARSRMATIGRKRAADLYSWEGVCRDYESTLLRTIKKRGQR